MKFSLSMIAFVLLLSGFAMAQNSQQSKELSKEIEKEVLEMQKYYNVPGISVAVVVGNQVIVCKGFGTADIDRNIPCTENTIFRLASSTKFFTNIAVLAMVQQGLINLDDPLKKYETDIPADWQDVRLYQLMNHTSGIPSTDETPFDKMSEDQQRKVTEHGLFDLIRHMPLDYKPGSKWRYQQTGFALVAMILEDKTGKSWPQLIKETITDPAGMENTYHNDEMVYPPGQETKNYNYQDGKLVSTPFFFPLVLGTGAGFNTTASDAAKLFLALNADKIVSAETIKKEVFNPERMYQLGPNATAWYSVSSEVKKFGPYLTTGHSGGPDLGNFRYSPDKKVGVAVFADRNNTGISEELTNRILKRILLDTPFSRQQVSIAYGIKKLVTVKSYDELCTFYEKAKADSARYKFNDAENDLNTVGYDFLNKGQTADGLKVFKLIVKEFPSSANAWDSLGEAYAKNGDRGLAISSYQKCLELNPQSDNAKSWLNKLQKGQ
ncbi:serine hydrolase [Mucilaginibacter sp. X4EP1]|uniref:serine hydrolase n=1 Tax=Mucilaginibacter sp. X4EP1 TaxID=2723092 RepID=UPI002167DECA|nr:serine hydrolase [Mucilaginibacter sp. X4EP1]MCS3814373.1 CubicO group peptidase (beta-lactamase class C family) [Mucilaginibacter sp. X4EP1]